MVSNQLKEKRFLKSTKEMTSETPLLPSYWLSNLPMMQNPARQMAVREREAQKCSH